MNHFIIIKKTNFNHNFENLIKIKMYQMTYKPGSVHGD